MKIKTLLLVILCLLGFAARAQLNQRFDNINYKALYFSDAVKLINTTPGLLIIDVRSPGEYADTSRSTTLNMGRLKGAINISIDSIEQHVKELGPFKNKPILVYCSHSQRSRAVSKFLSDQGFTDVNSLNGGMSLINKSTDQEFALKTKLYTTHLPYKLIQSQDACQFIADKSNLIIDVRPASQFNGTDTTEANNIGHIKGAINIPVADADKQIAALSAYKNRPVLFYDLANHTAVDIALKFYYAGFKKLFVLFEGMNTLLPNIPSASPLRAALFVNLPKYKAIGSNEAIHLVKTKPGLIIADMRSKAEFESKTGDAFQNLGHVKGAVNYTPATLLAYLKGKPKHTPLLVYGSNMAGMAHGTNPAATCKQLAQKGYTNVYLLNNGMYSLMWSVTNVENCKDGMAILADHLGFY